MAWIAGFAAVFVVIRVTIFGFGSQEGGSGGCPVPARSFFTVWGSDQYCLSQATSWLMAGRIAVVLAVLATLVWRYAYRRDRIPER